jgi:hypothetical protein
MPTLDTRQTPTTVYIYSNVMDEWARMRSGISSVEQVLQANVRHLKEQLKTDPACNVEFILETLAVLEATLLTIKEARD